MNLSHTLAQAQLQTQRVWALAAPYFSQSPQRWRARGLLLAIVALNLAGVGMLVLLNQWNVAFYDALQNRQAAIFWAQLGQFLYLAFGYMVIMVYKFYLSQLLELGWRRWMTEHTLQQWLSNNVFYTLELSRFLGRNTAQNPGPTPIPTNTQATAADSDSTAELLDNPDQRIQEDVAQFTHQTINLSMGFLNAVVILASFVGILWHVGGVVSFEFHGQAYHIPGFMVWMTLVYCLLGSWVTQIIGRKLSHLNFVQQRLEAHFRHRLVMVREYSAPIALERGQAAEAIPLRERFAKVMHNSLALIKTQKNLVWFTSGFNQAAMVFPFMVAAPRFFSGAIALGILMQIASAFGRVQDALGWFVENYTGLAAWHATTQRLTDFQARLADVGASGTKPLGFSPGPVASNSVLAHPLWYLRAVDLKAAVPTQDQQPPGASDASSLRVSGLRIYRPDGQCLLHLPEWLVLPGTSVLLQGPSGSGKSTFFRALAGLWPYVEGQVFLPQGSVFVPQRPYLPTGSLRAALAYPQVVEAYTTEAMTAALAAAALGPGHGDWAQRLDEEAAWGQQMSIGEQQRLSLARVFLQKPLWLFLDEATSALDAATEEVVYTRLQALLAQNETGPGSLISIAHQASLARFHSERWQLEPV